MASICCIQETKYVKCNSPHLTTYHHHFTWCCKANDKINPSRLETKKSEPCPHIFKCLNCKGNHQANSNKCPFWKHHFNKEWHTKEYAKLWETKKNSTHSAVNANKIWFWRTWKFSHKTFEKIISLPIQSLKLTTTSTLSLFRNHPGQHYNLFQAHPIVKAIL